MVVRWVYWSVLWWRRALVGPVGTAWNDGSDRVALRPGVAAQVAVQPDGALVLRLDLAGVAGWPGGVQPDGSE